MEQAAEGVRALGSFFAQAAMGGAEVCGAQKPCILTLSASIKCRMHRLCEGLWDAAAAIKAAAQLTYGLLSKQRTEILQGAAWAASVLARDCRRHCDPLWASVIRV